MTIAVFPENFSQIAATIAELQLKELKLVCSPFSLWKKRLKKLSKTENFENLSIERFLGCVCDDFDK
jgi:hypothetical protein